MNIPVAAEGVFTLGHLTVTNTLIESTILMIVFVVFSFTVSRSITKVPGPLQNAVESLIEFLLGYFDQVTGDRNKSKRFLPLVGTMFLFILSANWFGLLPGTGTIGIWHATPKGPELIPILRSANSDLNLTAAMAIVSVVTSHLLGMLALGFFVHWNKFFQFGSVWKAIKTFKPITILVALVEFIVGLIEVVSEAAKILSLSLRLFGNVFAGEVLMTVISSLISVAVPLPFMFLELIVGVVQATVFSMLTLVYLSTLTTAPHGSHEEDHGQTALQPA